MISDIAQAFGIDSTSTAREKWRLVSSEREPSKRLSNQDTDVTLYNFRTGGILIEDFGKKRSQGRMTVSPFGKGDRDVIARFLRKDAKNISDAAAGLSDAIVTLERTPQVDLKKTGRLTSLRDGVLEYRHHLKDHWLRLLVAYYPTGIHVVILQIVLKKTNRLDPDDIDIAIRNLKTYKTQVGRMN